MTNTKLYAPSTWTCVDEQHKALIQDLDSDFERYIWKLKRREITKSTELVSRTVDLLDSYISRCSAFTVAELLSLFREMGRVFTEARPIELIVGNVVRRVLHIIKHESVTTVSNAVDLSRSLYTHGTDDNASLTIPVSTIREAIQNEIVSLIEDVTSTDSTISTHAMSHIYSSEVILTYGYSRTVLNFLKKAYKAQRKFEVIIAEAAPTLLGQKMAAALANTGIDVTVISDAAVLAVMPSVSKVVMGTHAVLANGGLVAPIGGATVCSAARHHSVPVLVLCGTHKLTPLYAFDEDTFNEHNCPSQMVQFDEVLEGRVDVVNPGYDYVPPELVALIVTDEGAYAPAFIYSQLGQQYAPEFYVF